MDVTSAPLPRNGARSKGKVLVTGDQGFLGTVIAPDLIAAGYDVVGLDVGWFADCTLESVHETWPRWSCDLAAATREMFQGVDAVVHLAALSNDPLGDLQPGVTDEINHLATVRIAELARQAGVKRFVFSSSCSTYGQAGDEFLDENADFRPVTAYGSSKVDAERGLAELATDHFSPVYLRNATAYGFSPRLRLDLVVNDFVASALCEGRLVIKSDGTPWRPLVHVMDIGRAVRCALGAPSDAIHNRAFNIGQTVENFRVSQIAETVARAIPGTAIEYASGGSPDARCYRVNCDRAHRELPGFACDWTLERGVQDLVAQLQRVGFGREHIASRRFIRLARLKELQPTRGMVHSGHGHSPGLS